MKKYILFLVLQILVIFIVTLFFNLIDSRQVASVWAGFTFLFSAMLYFYSELKTPGLKYKNPLLITSGIFILLIAIPMLVTRIINWGADFSSLYVLGLPGPVFHKVSNYFYIAMMVSSIILIFQKFKSSSKSTI